MPIFALKWYYALVLWIMFCFISVWVVNGVLYPESYGAGFWPTKSWLEDLTGSHRDYIYFYIIMGSPVVILAAVKRSLKVLFYGSTIIFVINSMMLLRSIDAISLTHKKGNTEIYLSGVPTFFGVIDHFLTPSGLLFLCSLGSFLRERNRIT